MMVDGLDNLGGLVSVAVDSCLGELICGQEDGD